jgi:hypothetical protein
VRAKDTDTLETQLASYSRNVKSTVATESWSSRAGRWSIYAAATGAALASATSADASIITGFSGAFTVADRGCGGCEVFSSVKMQTFPGGTTGGGYPIANTIASFSLFAQYVLNPGLKRAQVAVTQAAPFFASKAVGFFVTTNSTHYHPILFAPGDPIVPGGYLYRGGGIHTYSKLLPGGAPVNLGWPTPGVTGIAAFQLSNGDLGWIRLMWSSYAGDGLSDRIDALDWAINTTPGEAIIAGAVPEPGTLPLMLLASGAAGILALRKRRQAK